MTIVPVILSGGSGTRLWPLSVATCPKQFLPLTSERSMIQETLLRLEGLETANPIIICNEAHRFIVAEQISSVSHLKPYILLEPMGRNTAPAIAVGALQALQQDPEAVMVVLPSDHVIADTATFQKAVLAAAEEAMNGSLVTFGIVPTQPHTGYGYIKTGKGSDMQPLTLEKFVEKPDYDTAVQYLAEGSYLWNSGMFVFKAQAFLDELAQFEPVMADLCALAWTKAAVETDFIRIKADFFSQIKGNSIDYAVMEKTTKGKVIRLDAGWDDVGSWSALWEINAKDENGNACKSHTVLLDTKNCYFNGKKSIAAIGVDNLVVVESDNAILVCNKDKVQDVKKVAEQLK